jgi:hypothetical protein
MIGESSRLRQPGARIREGSFRPQSVSSSASAITFRRHSVHIAILRLTLEPHREQKSSLQTPQRLKSLCISPQNAHVKRFISQPPFVQSSP